MRVIFMGTPEFSVPVLEALVTAGHEVVCAYTQPPRPAGRGKKERPSPVQARAEALGIEVRHPVSLKGAADQADFAALGAEVAVVVAYGLLLPQPILDAPERGCLNIHASLLPRWRGAAPIQRAVMAGDERTGICIMQMEAGLDTGPVLLRRDIAIGATETAGELHDRLSALGAETIVEALAGLDRLIPEAQPEDGVTYAAKIDKAEAQVDWTGPAQDITRKINGLSPFPGAWTELDGERLKLLCASVETTIDVRDRVPGEVVDDALVVACGEGAVRLLRVQKAGRAAQDSADFLRGTPLQPGTRFRVLGSA